MAKFPARRGASRPSAARPVRADRAVRAASELSRPIATTANGRDITRPWRLDLEQAKDPRLARSVDWGVYAEVARDPEVRSTFQQRRRAVTSAEWDIIPGDSDDPRSVECGDRFKENVERIGLDRITDKMLWATMNGYSVAEFMWEPRDGLLQWSGVKVRHARRFRQDQEGRVRLLTTVSMTQGELLPDRKFWWLEAGSSDDDDPYGWGLAADLYWPVVLKRAVFGFWSVALDKHGVPTAKGTYNRGATQADIDKLLQAIEAIANDAGFVIPEGMNVELLEMKGSGTATFEKLIEKCDDYIDKVILSQTMTSNDGSSNAQAQVHAGVKMEVVTGDADLFSEGFDAGPARWWTDFNYGPDVASPRLIRLLDEEEDLGAQADVDTKLKALGWVRTDESHRDVYGDGYERSPAAGATSGSTVDRPSSIDAPDNVVPLRPASFAEAESDDIVDQAVAALIAADGYAAIGATFDPVVAALERSDSPEQFREALLDAYGEADMSRLTDMLARAGFAVRVAAERGVDA